MDQVLRIPLKRSSGRWLAPVMLSIGMLSSGCGVATNGQSVGATTPTTHKAPPAATTTTTTPILVPGAAGTFSALPTFAAIGQWITYSGTGCAPTNQVQVLAPDRLLTNITPDVHGTWRVRAAVPDTAAIGDVKITAICLTPKGYAGHYTPVVVNITSSRRLVVEPATAHAGDTVNVTAVGSCNITPFAMQLELAGPDGVPLANQQDQALTLGPDGVWSGPFVVPAIAVPGPYVVVADCQTRGASYGFTPAAITVLAAGEPLPSTAPTASSAPTGKIPITR